MKKILISIAVLTAAATALPASAAPWTPIRQREAKLTARIDEGVRRGDLTRAEAARLRMELRDIEMREDRYRRTGGLNVAERADLEGRFDKLSTEVFAQRHDRQTRRN